MIPRMMSYHQYQLSDIPSFNGSEQILSCCARTRKDFPFAANIPVMRRLPMH